MRALCVVLRVRRIVSSGAQPRRTGAPRVEALLPEVRLLLDSTSPEPSLTRVRVTPPSMMTSATTPSSTLRALSLAARTRRFSGRTMTWAARPLATGSEAAAAIRLPCGPLTSYVRPHLFHSDRQHVGVAEELRREQAERTEIELVRGADLLDSALIHEADAVRHDQGLLLVVRDVKNGDAELGMKLLDLELHLVAQLLVEGAERLVHQDDRGPVDEATGERHPLLLPARQLARKALGHAGQTHRFEREGHVALDLFLRHAPHAQRKGDVLED